MNNGEVTVHEDALKFYDSNLKILVSASRLVKLTLENLLESNDMDNLGISVRVKERESLAKKLEKRRNLTVNREITDIIGARIILLLNSNVEKVCELIRGNFQIDELNSVDKKGELGRDRFGYISQHFICKFSPPRSNLPEYNRFEKISFEVQIRTAIQHAWADMSHSRFYKYSEQLPDTLYRRLSLVAGLLEMADNELDNIAREAGEFERETSLSIEASGPDIVRGSLIPSLDILRLISDYAKKNNLAIKMHHLSLARRELADFGYRSIDEVREAIGRNSHIINDVAPSRDSSETTNILGFLRDVMLLDNVSKYFSDAWKGSWGIMDKPIYNALVSLHNQAEINAILNRFDVALEQEYDENPPSYASDQQIS